MHPFDGVRVKISRGYAHTLEYERELKTFRKTNPYSVRIEIDPHSGDKLWIANEGVKDPSLSFSAIIGDAIHNFRSALDHLAYQLVIANGATPDDHTAFPICAKVSQWSRAQAKLDGMDDRVKALIKAQQPCFSTHCHRKQWFVWLEELDIVDKHRQIQLTQAATAGGLWNQELPISVTTFIHEGVVENNTILARVPQAYAYVDFYPAVDISFGQGTSASGELVLLGLHRFKVLTEFMVKSLEPFIPH